MSFFPAPTIGAAIHLLPLEEDLPGVPELAGLTTRVLAVHEDSVTVEAPFLHPNDWPAVGSTFEVRWFSDRGRHELPASLDVYNVTGTKWWELFSLGTSRTVQERRYVRGGGGERVTLQRVDDHEPFPATVMDLAERSIRVRVAPGLLTGQEVLLTVTLDGQALRLEGTVFRVRGTEDLHSREVVILLEPDPGHEDAIRGYIFAAQVRARSAALNAEV